MRREGWGEREGLGGRGRFGREVSGGKRGEEWGGREW